MLPCTLLSGRTQAAPAYLTFDKPSDQFRSFADPDITETGIELDSKLAALLDHLSVAVLHELLSR
jgi:hypothetical protein